MGHRVGIVANSDGHKGRPGACYPGASFFGSYGGLTCFIAERLDRDAIFEALRRRRHYATTGNRGILDVAVELADDAEVFVRDPGLGPSRSERARRLLMGDIARVGDDAAELAIDVLASAPIERIDIFDGLELLETVRPYTDADLGARVRMVYEGAEYRGRARTTTWDGTLSIEQNQSLRTSVINSWKYNQGIRRQDSNALAWKAVTRVITARSTCGWRSRARVASPARPRRCRVKHRLPSSASNPWNSRPAAWSAHCGCSDCLT